jgi:hypothetical protein
MISEDPGGGLRHHIWYRRKGCPWCFTLFLSASFFPLFAGFLSLLVELTATVARFDLEYWSV